MHRQTYMRRVVDILTFTALSVHILFGCCLHHAHKFDGAFESEALAVKPACTCSSHSHGENEGTHKPRGQQEQGQPDHDSQHKHCDGDTCVFMRADSVNGSDPLDGQNLFATVTVPECPVSSGNFEIVDMGLKRLGVSIPIHLANQALLL
ncbi:MAG: hypothetical protein JXM70_22715 [Pirellulales bacterium]|nr:hypothetical protein [Pirellulales bacterium]